jgi:flavin-dependent dehydrogenase
MEMAAHTYDVVVVGASIAGCTAATLYGRAGLKVALIERQQDIKAYKKLCTHYIQPSAKPTLDRLGLSAQIEAVGGIRNGMTFWTKWGWIRPYDDPRFPPHGYSLRREKLDPMLRQLAAETPGVDLFLGQAARELLWGKSRVIGVMTGEQKSKQTHTFHGRLVVAADGHYSKLAELSGVKAWRWPNGRFGYFTYYRQLPLRTGHIAQVWFLQPDVAYAFPNDEDITLVAYMPINDKMARFKQDPLAALEQHVAALPDGPDVQKDVDRALRQYQKRHRWQLAAHNWYNGRFASGRNFYLYERVALAAAARDEQCARHIHAFAARNSGVADLHSPRNFARAAWVNLSQAFRDRRQGR